jgi:hypothetical protein
LGESSTIPSKLCILWFTLGKCDEHGPIDIYHYISKKRLGTRQVEELNKWDYDEEIWLRDDIWSYCGPYPTYPEPDWLTEDFESKLVADAMNN